jgi:hypothetical protein
MRVLAIAVLVWLGGPAHAHPDGGAQLHYELQGLHNVDRDTMTGIEANEVVLAGARLHGFVGKGSLGFHIGLDLAAGGTVDAGGFAYDVALFPAGFAFRFAQTSFVTLGIGVGASGATGTLDDAATFPLEARFELGRGLRLLGRGRITYVAAADGRKDGTVSTPIGDELEAMLALRFGTAYSDWGFPTGNGYFVGVTVREALGAQFLGAVIGYSIDMGTSRRGH